MKNVCLVQWYNVEDITQNGYCLEGAQSEKNILEVQPKKNALNMQKAII